MKTNKPMLEYLATCSRHSLEAFELARLNERANLRKQLIEVLDQWVEADVQSRVAGWILAQHRERTAAAQSSERKSRLLLELLDFATASDNSTHENPAQEQAVFPLLDANDNREASAILRSKCGPKSLSKCAGKPFAKCSARSSNKPSVLPAAARVA